MISLYDLVMNLDSLVVEGHETKIIQLTLPETNIAHENPHVSL